MSFVTLYDVTSLVSSSHFIVLLMTSRACGFGGFAGVWHFDQMLLNGVAAA